MCFYSFFFHFRFSLSGRDRARMRSGGRRGLGLYRDCYVRHSEVSYHRIIFYLKRNQTFVQVELYKKQMNERKISYPSLG